MSSLHGEDCRLLIFYNLHLFLHLFPWIPFFIVPLGSDHWILRKGCDRWRITLLFRNILNLRLFLCPDLIFLHFLIEYFDCLENHFISIDRSLVCCFLGLFDLFNLFTLSRKNLIFFQFVLLIFDDLLQFCYLRIFLLILSLELLIFIRQLIFHVCKLLVHLLQCSELHGRLNVRDLFGGARILLTLKFEFFFIQLASMNFPDEFRSLFLISLSDDFSCNHRSFSDCVITCFNFDLWLLGKLIIGLRDFLHSRFL